MKKKEKQQTVNNRRQKNHLYEEYANIQQVFQQYRGNHFTAKQMQSYKIQYKNQQLTIRNMMTFSTIVIILLELSSDHFILLIYVGFIQLMICEVDLEITHSSCNAC